jgi:hypothetical protein
LVDPQAKGLDFPSSQNIKALPLSPGREFPSGAGLIMADKERS